MPESMWCYIDLMDVIIILLWLGGAIIVFRILLWFSGWLIIFSPAIVGFLIAALFWSNGQDNLGVTLGLVVFVGGYFIMDKLLGGDDPPV